MHSNYFSKLDESYDIQGISLFWSSVSFFSCLAWCIFNFKNVGGCLIALVVLGYSFLVFNGHVFLKRFYIDKWIYKIIAIVVFFLTPILSYAFGYSFTIILSLLGLLAFCINCRLSSSFKYTQAGNYVVIFAALFIALYLVTRHELINAKQLVFDGELYLDWIRGAATTNIINKLKVISQGVNGVPLHIYHFGAFLWLSAFVPINELNAVMVLSLVFTIFVFPFLYYSLSVSIYFLNPVERNSIQNISSIALALFLSCLCDLYGWASYYKSLSWPLALSLFLLVFPVTFNLTDSYTSIARIFSLIMLPVLSLYKISAGFLWFNLLLISDFKKPILDTNKIKYLLVASLILVSSVFVLVSFYRETEAYDGGDYFAAFHFYTKWGSFTSMYSHFIALFLLFIYSTLKYGKIIDVNYKGELNRFIKVTEVSLSLSIFTLLPGAIFAIGGGSAWYFLNLTQWLCVATLASFTEVIYMAILKSADKYINFKYRIYLKTFMYFVIAGFGLKIFSLIINTSSISWNQIGAKIHISGNSNFLGMSYGNNKSDDIDNDLIEISKLVGEKPFSELIYIDESQTWYWKRFKDCRSGSYFVQATTGHALIYGAPSEEVGCVNNEFDERSAEKVTNHFIDDAALCRKANLLGFHTVSRLRRENNEITLKEINNCFSSKER